MTETTTMTLPGEVVRQDHAYESQIASAETAVVERDRLRWEWTVCPNGPMLSFAEYGRQVGKHRDTIRRSADAVTESRTTRQSVTCRYDHARFEPTQKATEEDAKAHKEAKHRVTAGEVGALIVRTLATLASKSENTIEHNATWTPLQQRARARVAAEVPLDTDDAEQRIVAICAEVYQEHKEREAAVVRVKRWMAENRGLNASEVSVPDARDMVDRISRTAQRKGLSFTDAESEVRDWDRRRAAADRIKNEQIKKARHAVLNLMQSAAKARQDGLDMVKAVRQIEDDEVPLTDDERALALADLDTTETAIRLAKSALSGNSGTNWDDELARLIGDNA